MKAKGLFGKEVIDVHAEVVGKVVDIELDMSKAKILGILVKTGLTKKVSILPGDVDKIGDKILLKIVKDKIQKA
ncbi:MAG: PRC-barrel domain-containing protein [Dehalococcoidia bacterium]|nr:PRC-barrel domain-containing protein [Dehalococcoidia bacterium]